MTDVTATELHAEAEIRYSSFSANAGDCESAQDPIPLDMLGKESGLWSLTFLGNVVAECREF